MMNSKGDFIGQVCHIEAAERGGERYNDDMTDEQRREASNLMLMCYEHHVETNDTLTFQALDLQKMKADHESKFGGDLVAATIRMSLTDRTGRATITLPSNLQRLSDVLDWGHSTTELAMTAAELSTELSRLKDVPEETRILFGNIAIRAARLAKASSGPVRVSLSGARILLAADIESAFGLTPEIVIGFGDICNDWNLGSIEIYDDDAGTYGFQFAVTSENGWPLWDELANFCVQSNTPVDRLFTGLDFSVLDS
jgi:hypothetical protein